ncbi:MAG: hypothetical protein QFC55_08390 [Chloroflexota bacterium]|nr:hypothetical protein [Chloroflexota bacterium]
MARPTGVTLVSIFLIVIGVLMLLVGVLALAGGALLGNALGDINGGGLLAGVAAFFGVIVIFWAILHLMGGIGSLQGKGWGRWTGIVVAVITLVFGVLGLLGSFSGGLNGSSLVYQLVVIALYGATAYVLIKSSAWFARR